MPAPSAHRSERQGKLVDLAAISAAEVGVQQFGPRGHGLRSVLFGEQKLAPLVSDFHVSDQNGRIDAFQDGCLGKDDLLVEIREFDFTLRTGADRLGRQAPGLRLIRCTMNRYF